MASFHNYSSTKTIAQKSEVIIFTQKYIVRIHV